MKNHAALDDCSGMCYFKVGTYCEYQDKIICSAQWSLSTFSLTGVATVAGKGEKERFPTYTSPRWYGRRCRGLKAQTEKQVSRLFLDCLTNTGFPEVRVLRTDPPLIPGAVAKLSAGTGDPASAAQPLPEVSVRTRTCMCAVVTRSWWLYYPWGLLFGMSVYS